MRIAIEISGVQAQRLERVVQIANILRPGGTSKLTPEKMVEAHICSLLRTMDRRGHNWVRY